MPLQIPDHGSLPARVVELITLSDAALTKAASALAMQKEASVKTAATAARIEALIPKVVETMLAHNRINPDQGVKLAAALRDPVATLELLCKTASHRNISEQAILGQASGAVKTAAANGSTIKESDRVLFAALGLPVPTGL